MKNEIKALLEAIKADYYKFQTRNGTKELGEISKKMIAEFNASIEVKEGRKYTKIIRNNSVWGFIAREDFQTKTKSFVKGDLLMAAGWAAPALNKARGNIFANSYNAPWTGPTYL